MKLEISKAWIDEAIEPLIHRITRMYKARRWKAGAKKGKHR